MEYTTEIDGIEYTFTIDYTMGVVDNGRGGTVWGVEEWYVTHVDDHKIDRSTRGIWSAKLNAEEVVDAIINWER